VVLSGRNFGAATWQGISSRNGFWFTAGKQHGVSPLNSFYSAEIRIRVKYLNSQVLEQMITIGYVRVTKHVVAIIRSKPTVNKQRKDGRVV
jgi:hypothetical protein